MGLFYRRYLILLANEEFFSWWKWDFFVTNVLIIILINCWKHLWCGTNLIQTYFKNIISQHWKYSKLSICSYIIELFSTYFDEIRYYTTFTFILLSRIYADYDGYKIVHSSLQQLNSSRTIKWNRVFWLIRDVYWLFYGMILIERWILRTQ